MNSSSGLRILVADDNRVTAFSLGRILEQRGHETRAVLNGLAALDLVREFHPHVVLIDIGMPGIDGHEVTRQIRQEPGFQNTLIVIISGHNRDEDIAKSLASGANFHLVKPIDFDRLWVILDEAVPIGASDADVPT